MCVLRAHTSAVSAVAWISDRELVTGSEDGTSRVWVCTADPSAGAKDAGQDEDAQQAGDDEQSGGSQEGLWVNTSTFYPGNPHCALALWVGGGGAGKGEEGGGGGAGGERDIRLAVGLNLGAIVFAQIHESALVPR